MKTVNVDIKRITVFTPPQELKTALRTGSALDAQVLKHRQAIRDILDGRDKRKIAIVGPCSIHDRDSALEYGSKLHTVAKEVENDLLVVMRAYFAKPRTITGWKGLFYDPQHTLNGGDVVEGARLVRQISHDLVGIGLPIATEVLDEYMIQYIDDLVSWACIGARTVESQPHRELASGLSSPVGMKNSTDGRVKVAIDAMESASHPHEFRGMTEEGRVANFLSTGNRYTHLVLRGGGGRSNYDGPSIDAAVAEIVKRNEKGASLHANVIVDASHDNSGKVAANQPAVVQEILAMNHPRVVGFMVESNLYAGKQSVQKGSGLAGLKRGVSITDECIGFDETAALLKDAARKKMAA